MNEISLRTEMLIQMYELIEQSSQNRVEQAQVTKMQIEFQQKSNEL